MSKATKQSLLLHVESEWNQHRKPLPEPLEYLRRLPAQPVELLRHHPRLYRTGYRNNDSPMQSRIDSKLLFEFNQSLPMPRRIQRDTNSCWPGRGANRQSARASWRHRADQSSCLEEPRYDATEPADNVQKRLGCSTAADALFVRLGRFRTASTPAANPNLRAITYTACGEHAKLSGNSDSEVSPSEERSSGSRVRWYC